MGSKNNAGTISLAAIGEKLKSAREKKGVTIDQAQRQTHIHSTVISALESGRSDEVLTPTYVKSFLKKYSSYLALDSNQLVKEYQALHPDLDSLSSSLGGDRVVINNRTDIAGYLRILRNVGLIAVCAFLLVITVRGAFR
ncbi:MAG: helix-turn-helix domain-containing protein, partial [Candidatus Omnitrophica bacterium]|nr:helix-turn-helix domain-containing protein [Candidatus Omnitrophota bacterium]